MVRSVFAGICLTGALSASAAAPKFILHGWDTMNMLPGDVLANVGKFDRMPIAGVGLTLRDVKQPDGSVFRCGNPATSPKVDRATLEPFVETFRRLVAHPSQQDDFLVTTWMCYSHFGKAPLLDDDAAWERVAHNLAELARLAKRGGLRGLFIDNEDYTGIGFFRVPEGMPKEAVYEAVRARARQVFGAMFREFPDMKLMCMWILSEYRRYFYPGEIHEPGYLDELYRTSGLLAWYNGMLDVVPPTVTIIDGNETGGYSVENVNGGFYKETVLVKKDLLRLVRPENRAKYRAQVEAGYGLYLDEFINDRVRTTGTRKGQPNNWYRGSVNGSRAEHFRRTLEGAVDAADEYVWLYGEAFSFIDWGEGAKNRTTWREKIGLDTKLALVQDRGGTWARKRAAEIRAEGKEPNVLAAVTDFTLTVDGSNAVAKAFNVTDVTNRIPYVIDARVKGDGSIAAYWIVDGMWSWDIPPLWFAESVVSEELADGWKRLTVVLQGPLHQPLTDLVVEFTAKSGTVEFRDVALYRLDSDAPAGRLELAPRPRASRMLADPVMKAYFDEQPKLWRVNGDAVVFQHVQFGEKAMKMWKERDGRR